MENHTARHFVLQLGSLASLYLSLSFLLVLIFGVINLAFPDATNGYWEIESAHQGVRIGFAMVIVFFPTYLILTRTVNKLRRTETSGAYLSLTKWLVYLSLLVGGGVLLGDLVTVIMTFLEGEITQRFILKAAAVFVVIGAAFHYYILDARGFWLKNEAKSVQFAYGAIAVVIASLAYGFTSIEAPTEVREQKLDATQVSDLQQIQWRVQDYYLTNQKLPENLGTLGEPAAPTAPEGRADYKYNVTNEGFELCATFAQPSNPDEFMGGTMPISEKGFIKNPDNWQHGAGETCFSRIINKDNGNNIIPLDKN
ncbi:MAG: hypothetical protein KBC62_02560 [Candidatus Pacebacteria bacterium]|nr:hypothetical protein [Candidatus Paceibacterota bacterium]